MADNGMLKLDYTLNASWLKRQFREEWLVIRADPNNRTDGIIGRQLRLRWLGDLLIATGHEVNWKIGTVNYKRRK